MAEVAFADEQDGVEIDGERLTELAKFVLDAENVAETAEMGLVAVDKEQIAQLNLEFRSIDGPTDVLSFPVDGADLSDAAEAGPIVEGEPAPPPLIGDVVLCPEVARANAGEYRVAVGAELDLLVVHGVLHLLGHDHSDDAEAEIMEGREARLLAAFAARDDYPADESAQTTSDV